MTGTLALMRITKTSGEFKMYCDLRSAISPDATIMKPVTTLRALPPATEVAFPGLYGWSPISTGSLTAALRLDRGLWATWRNRGLTPPALPDAWFRRTTGQPRIYRVDAVLAWIAARRGEEFDTLTCWRHSLLTGFDQDETDPSRVRAFARMYAEAIGPRLPGGVAFTPAGFRDYLASLLV